MKNTAVCMAWILFCAVVSLPAVLGNSIVRVVSFSGRCAPGEPCTDPRCFRLSVVNPIQSPAAWGGRLFLEEGASIHGLNTILDAGDGSISEQDSQKGIFNISPNNGSLVAPQEAISLSFCVMNSAFDFPSTLYIAFNHDSLCLRKADEKLTSSGADDSKNNSKDENTNAQGPSDSEIEPSDENMEEETDTKESSEPSNETTEEIGPSESDVGPSDESTEEEIDTRELSDSELFDENTEEGTDTTGPSDSEMEPTDENTEEGSEFSDSDLFDENTEEGTDMNGPSESETGPSEESTEPSDENPEEEIHTTGPSESEMEPADENTKEDSEFSDSDLFDENTEEETFTNGPSESEMEPPEESTEDESDCDPTYSSGKEMEPYEYHVHTGEESSNFNDGWYKWESRRDLIEMCNPSTTPTAIDSYGELYPESLYQSNCFGRLLIVDIPVNPGQVYEVNLHFAETYPPTARIRTFDIRIYTSGTGPLIEERGFNIVSESRESFTALVKKYLVLAGASDLHIELEAIEDNALLSGFEVIPLVSPSHHDFRHLNINKLCHNSKVIDFFSPSTTYRISGVLIEDNGLQRAGEAFTLQFGDGDSFSAMERSIQVVNQRVNKGEGLEIIATLAPTERGEYSITVTLFDEDGGTLGIFEVKGAGGTSDSPFLHAVIAGPHFAIDWDGDEVEAGSFDGELSHTHEPGRVLSRFEWSKDGSTISDEGTLVEAFSLGDHHIVLTISDNDVPKKSVSEFHSFSVVSPQNVPGALVRFYEHASIVPLDELPEADIHSAEVIDRLRLHLDVPNTDNVLAHIYATVHLESEHIPAAFRLKKTEGVPVHLRVDGDKESEGPVKIEILVFLTDVETQLPIELEFSVNGEEFKPIPPEIITHDQTKVDPVINFMTPIGSPEGENTITIRGLGWNPDDLDIIMDGEAISQSRLLRGQTTATEIYFSAPPSMSEKVVTVRVESGGERTSNAKPYEYKDGVFTPEFVQKAINPIKVPTVNAWCFGKLYLGTLFGEIVELTFDENYEVTAHRTIQTLVDYTPMKGILGLACGIKGTESDFKLYVSHSEMFMNGGKSEGLDRPAPFSGAVSYLNGPNFEVLHPLIGNLGVSNFDHVINGLEFDNEGNLLILSGSVTNAGIRGDGLGGLDECPLSAAILIAEIDKPGFDGEMVYKLRNDERVNDIINKKLEKYEMSKEEAVEDQRFCRYLEIDSGDVRVLGPGLRNPLGVVYTTKDKIYTTENGPNAGLGEASLFENQDLGDGEEVGAPDELNLIEEGNYYGSANPSRGYDDPRQVVYRGPGDAAATLPVAILDSSSNGLVEYRSEAFGGIWKGDLMIQRFNTDLNHYIEGDNGKWYRDENGEGIPNGDGVTTPGLDVDFAPGGVLLSSSIGHVQVWANIPQDPREHRNRPVALDITPWRDFEDGGSTFIIGGYNFNMIKDVEVVFGGERVADLDMSVTRKRIKGTVPEYEGAPENLIDVSIRGTLDGRQELFTLEKAFRYLKFPNYEPPQ